MAKPRITKRWRLAPRASANQLARLGNRQPLLAQILFNRGLRTDDDVQQFLCAAEIHRQPEAMLGVPAAVEHIFAALGRGERIAVYGDFDADGITAPRSSCKRCWHSAQMPVPTFPTVCGKATG